MKNLTVRPSSLSRLMTNSRSKKDLLSETAKSYVKECVLSDFYGIEKSLYNKQLGKGTFCEDETIDLLNIVEFESFEKNEVTKDIGWIKGTCDIDSKCLVDIKTSWDFNTFPHFKEDADKIVKKSGYEWQVRAYMMLYNRDSARVVFGLVDTPDDLLSDYDDEAIHKISHIEPNKRITSSSIFHRCDEKENQIKERYEIANEYYQELYNQLKNK